MGDSFDAFHYIGYMRARRWWIAASCATACVLALAISAAMPREYTATARILIEPPAGSDLRSAMAISPIYLESLKTYEHFATSDSLFRKALDNFGLHGSGARPIESLKRRILRVEIVRSTRIMEISATLPDARKAQAMAQFLAESTVELNRSLTADSDRELIHTMEQQAADLRTHMQQVDAAWSRLLSTEPVDDLRDAQENAATLRSNLEEQAVGIEVEAADAAQRGDRSSEANARTRATELRRQIALLERQSNEREKLLAARSAHRDTLEAERKTAQTSLAAVENRLREARGAEGYRGERLKIVDPSIVPERPSSPNVQLNLFAALLLGLVLPVLYFTVEMAWEQQRTGSHRTVFRSLAKVRDE
jgi:capsular polysaccharide biosynthesis protein